MGAEVFKAHQQETTKTMTTDKATTIGKSPLELNLGLIQEDFCYDGHFLQKTGHFLQG
jgi:hypothetical protein